MTISQRSIRLVRNYCVILPVMRRAWSMDGESSQISLLPLKGGISLLKIGVEMKISIVMSAMVSPICLQQQWQ